MPRYVQIKNQAGEWELIEVGEPERGRARLQIIGAKPHDNYVSPIDGSVITSQRKEREHMRKHNVVRPGDFGNNEGVDHFNRVRKEHQDLYDGKSESHKREVKAATAESVRMLNEGYKPRPLEKLED